MLTAGQDPNFLRTSGVAIAEQTQSKRNDLYNLNNEGGMAWNDPEIGIEWLGVIGEYQGCASADSYSLEGVKSYNPDLLMQELIDTVTEVYVNFRK